MALFEDLPCPVVNRIGGGMSNNSKPYQSLLLARAGLTVPATLVTSDPDAARAFQAEHGDVIYKSASGIRSIVRRLGPEQLARLAFLRNGPAQFQAFVPGHNVGCTPSATRSSPPGSRPRQSTTATPAATGSTSRWADDPAPAVEDACLRAARELDLLFAGIDLKETPDGEYVCFEVNPCPGFIYYERHTGQPISAALADLLNGTPRPPALDHATAMHQQHKGGNDMADNENEETSKEPFVSQADRPEVRLKSDTPVSELTVRDLATLLGQLGPTGKDFWDGKDWIKDDFDGPATSGRTKRRRSEKEEKGQGEGEGREDGEAREAGKARGQGGQGGEDRDRRRVRTRPPAGP